MAHKREQIRKAVLAMLSTQAIDDSYPTNAGENVFANRVAPLWQTELPAILIYVNNETAVTRAINSRQSIRSLTLAIEARAEANSELDDALDDLATQIENIITADRSLTGTALGAVLTDTEISLEAGEKDIGKLVLTFQVQYIE
jgi:hypothetical protein